MTSPPTTSRLAATLVAVGLIAAVAAALGLGVPALDGEPGAAAAVDEPQYLLTALSLAEDGTLDIADELAAGREGTFHPAPLPVQTEVRPDGTQVSPHDPLLAVLLAPAVAVGGWVGAKLLLASLAGALAALSIWVAVRRFGVPLAIAGIVVAAAATSAPLSVYGQQVYPELPAALAVLVAVAALTGRLGRGGLVALVLAVVALPWLSVKYAPLAAVLTLLGLVVLWRTGRAGAAAAVAAALGAAGAAFLGLHQVLYGGWTAYAAGDHFQTSGELGVVGLSPDYAGRSTRLVGLLVDRDFGLVAWQPAWLLLVPAVAALPRLLPRGATPGWTVLVVPLLTGWLVATFVALTMHGYWWPGRQVVVVLPLGVLAVTVWLTHLHRTIRPSHRAIVSAAALLAAAGTGLYAWVLVAGWSGRLSWVDAPDQP
ncbi:MAG: hypothetical protein H0U47_09060, partial [Nocardioidaceae bacterium]|nr:hypothetical protein [Nocardioidaceae bacterium]